MAVDFTLPQSTFEISYVAVAGCPAGEVVVSGGYVIGPEGVNEFRGSLPDVSPVSGVQGWEVDLGADEDVDGTVSAICLETP